MRLYIIKHFIKAKTLKEALKLSKKHEPDEAFLADEWYNKRGFLSSKEEGKEVRGFDKKM